MTSILKADDIQDSSGNNIINESGDVITIGASGDTIDIPSGATLDATGATITGALANTPAFQAYMNGNQTIGDASWTKLEMDAEVFDTDSTYDVSLYRFTPAVAGKYWVWGKFRYDQTSDIYSASIGLYLNGALISKSVEFITNVTTKVIGITVTLDDDDYLECYAYQNSGGTVTVNGGSYPEQDTGTWGAYKIIGA